MSSSSPSQPKPMNRKQFDKSDVIPARPSTYNPIVIPESAITEDDLRAILTSSKTTGNFCCLMPQKKELLLRLLFTSNTTKEITQALQNVDTANQIKGEDSIFKLRYDQAIKKYTNKNVITRTSNNELANC